MISAATFSIDTVFPAGAGVIPVPGPRPEILFRFPRRCGGDPAKADEALALYRFSPQVRG